MGEFLQIRAFSKVQSKMCSVHFKDFVSFPLKSVVDHSRPSRDNILYGE